MPTPSGTGQPTHVGRAIQAIHTESPGLPPALAELYALLALVKGPNTTLSDVHDAWSIWCHATHPGHRSLRPFGRLAPDVQELDRPYMEAIHRATETLRAH